MITQYTTLNMVPGSKPQVSVSQYDTGARVLVFRLKTGYTPFTPPEGCTAIIHGIKTDNTYFSYAAEIENDTVIADCTEQMTALPGFVECEIRLSNEEGHVGSCNFVLFVEKSPMVGAVISDTEIEAIETLTDRSEAAANSAQASAASAAGSATSAGESATNAAESASEAQEASEQAQASASAAAGSASAAQAAQTAAGAFAENAAASAQTASGKALDAQAAATAASGSASAAATSAGSASGSANAAAGSASDASDSAAAALVSERAAAQSASDIAASVAQIQTNTDNIAALQIVESTEAADITSIEDGADGVPMKSLKVYIEPVQSGSGDPSPDNIRPISGWDSVETVRTGVNLFDEEWEVGGIDVYTGANVTATDRIRSKGYIRVIPGMSYYFKSSNTIGLRLYDEHKQYVNSTVQTNMVYTIPNDVYYIRFIVLNTTTYNHDISINYPSTDTAYHPYEGQTITTDLPSTVYGGVLDVVTGELTVDRAIVDLGTLNWNYQAASGNMYADGALQNRLVHGASICSIYARNEVDEISGVGGLATNDRYACQYNYASRIIIRDTDYTDAASFKAAVTGQTLVYELAAPTTYTLTPEEVKTLLKANNVFANAGQTAIVYVADPKTYIDNAIADAVASLT